MKKYTAITSLGLLLLGGAFYIHPLQPARAQVQAQSVDCNAWSSDLAMGNNGSGVIALQTWLIANNFDIPAITSGLAEKGYFGPETNEALKKYQANLGVPATGYFGKMTRAKIDSNNACANPVAATTTPAAVGNTPGMYDGSDIMGGSGTSATGGTSTMSGIGRTNCGNQTYGSVALAAQGMASSGCFDRQFSLCRPATETVSITAQKTQETIEYQIIGTSSSMCEVSETITMPTVSKPAVLSCLFDDTKKFSVAGLDATACSPQ